MGHREDLLEGAKRCLLEKGFVRTTARDIVKESGTNLASIGYHYGSKDALLALAYVELISDAGDTFGAFALTDTASAPGSLERFQEAWESITRSFVEDRPIWMLTFEVITNSDRLPTVREHLAKASDEGRRGLVPMLAAWIGGGRRRRHDAFARRLLPGPAQRSVRAVALRPGLGDRRHGADRGAAPGDRRGGEVRELRRPRSDPEDGRFTGGPAALRGAVTASRSRSAGIGAVGIRAPATARTAA